MVCSVSLPLDARESAGLPSPGNNRTAPLPVNPRGPTFASLSCPRPTHLRHPVPTRPCRVTAGSHSLVTCFTGQHPVSGPNHPHHDSRHHGQHFFRVSVAPRPRSRTSSTPCPKSPPEWPAPSLSRGLVGTAQWAQPKYARERPPCVGQRVLWALRVSASQSLRVATCDVIRR